jgi:hypothetical protein
VGQRVERQPALLRSRRIAEPIGNPTMRDLMKNDGRDDGQRPNSDLLDNFQKYFAGVLLI